MVSVVMYVWRILFMVTCFTTLGDLSCHSYHLTFCFWIFYSFTVHNAVMHIFIQLYWHFFLHVHCIGVAVLFSYLKIEQFHSIAWFNVAFGIAQLFLFIFLFRGESSCKKIKQCQQLCSGSTMTSPCPSALQLFISLTVGDSTVTFLLILMHAYHVHNDLLRFSNIVQPVPTYMRKTN